MKIAIIGCGKVGSTAAFALLYTVKPKEIMLIDRNKAKVEAEALDLCHAANSTLVKSSVDIKDAKDSDLIIITAGKPRTPGSNETRADLAKTNEPIIRDFMEEIMKVAPKAHIIMVTNPSTQMGEVAKEYTPNVTVMDNQLDTVRLRYFIGGCSKSEVTGEHGENMQFIFKDKLTEDQKKRVTELTKGAGRKIIEGKGYTNWGIAAQICEVIKRVWKH